MAGREARPRTANARSTFAMASLRLLRRSGAMPSRRDRVSAAPIELLGLSLEVPDRPDQVGKSLELSSRLRPRGFGLPQAAGVDEPQLVDVLAQRQAIRDESERHDVGRGGTHGDQCVQTGGRGVAQELGIAEFLHPVEVIVDRVIHPVAASHAAIDGRDAQVIDEHGVVGARSPASSSAGRILASRTISTRNSRGCSRPRSGHGRSAASWRPRPCVGLRSRGRGDCGPCGRR